MQPGADRLAAAWAAGHHGLITLAAARRCGLSDDAVRTRVATGRWERLTRTVFRIAGAPETPMQRALAACLACPAGAVISHLSAVAAHGLGPAPEVPHITVPRSASARNRLATVHRSDVPARDRTRIGPVPVTTVARTVVDCAALDLGAMTLADIVDDVLHRRLSTVRDIDSALARSQTSSGRPGSAQLREVLSVWRDGIRPGSPAEVRLFRRLREWGFPRPESQLEVRDGAGRVVARLDAGWPQQKVGLEYDGERFHGPRRISADETRHAAVEGLGWRLLRADHTDLRPSAHRLRDELEEALSA